MSTWCVKIVVEKMLNSAILNSIKFNLIKKNNTVHFIVQCVKIFKMCL